MKLRSPGQALYVALLMLLDWRLQQHFSGLWFLFVAPGVLLCSQRDGSGDVTLTSCLTVIALCWVAFVLHLG